MNVEKPSDFKTMLDLNETGKVKCIDGEFYIQKKHVHHVMDKYRQEVLESVRGKICGCPQVKEFVGGECWYGYRTERVLRIIDKAIKGGA